MITTLQQFLDRARVSNADQIYEMFDKECDDAVRIEIYDHCPEEHLETEPARASFYELGVKYDIQSLKDY